MEPDGARRRAKSRWIAGALVLALAAAWAFQEFEPLRHRSLAFETAPACDHSSGAWNPPQYLTSWEGATFIIKANEYPNCADRKVQRVSAHVLGERIFLRIRSDAPWHESYACHCSRITHVRLAGLEKRDYRVVPILPP
jgi:hypothetical protein